MTLPMCRKTAAGFTLVELLLVLTLITALTAIAVPSLGKSVRHHAHQSVAEELAEVVRFGRAEAVRLGRPLRLVYLSDANAYRLEVQQSGLALNAAYEPLPDTLFAPYTVLPRGVALELAGSPGGSASFSVVFPPEGAMSPVEITVRDADRAVVVRLGGWIDEVSVSAASGAGQEAA